ncbi:MAG: hypothetical protein GY812_12460 [Actinomycetia bacterium]|nr:hypothetical protein [Actinomycetes bacterium]
MTEYAWIWAAVAIGVGLLIGEIGGSIVRASMGRNSRSESTRDRALAVSRGIFWGSVAIGLVGAAAILDSDELADFGELLSDGLPRVLLAVVVVILGYAVALAVAAMVGQSARKGTGVRQVALERGLKIGVVAVAVVVALVVAGVDDAMLLVFFSALIGAPALALALLSAFGGRGVASQVAAGRALRHRLRAGWDLEVGSLRGQIVALHTTFVEVEDETGERHQLPNRWLLERPYQAGPTGS